MKYQSALICSLLITGLSTPSQMIATHNRQELSTNINSYYLPDTHKLKPILDSIFTKKSILKCKKSFIEAGFKTISLRWRGSLRVAKHPLVKGYLFKMYLRSETPFSLSNCNQRLVQRCKSATIVRKIIERHQIQHFTVPEKWLYKVNISSGKLAYVLLVQDMRLASKSKCKKAWSNKINRRSLRELYTIFRSGYGSLALLENIPYTKDRNFSFVDVEFSPREFKLNRINRYLSPKLRPVWKKIILHKKVVREAHA